MRYAGHLTQRYFERTGQASDRAYDAAWQFERAVLRDMLGRLEVILEDEGVDQGTAHRVIRCMLYGAPGAAGAELRERQNQEIKEMAALRE